MRDVRSTGVRVPHGAFFCFVLGLFWGVFWGLFWCFGGVFWGLFWGVFWGLFWGVFWGLFWGFPPAPSSGFVEFVDP